MTSGAEELGNDLLTSGCWGSPQTCLVVAAMRDRSHDRAAVITGPLPTWHRGVGAEDLQYPKNSCFFSENPSQ